MIEPVDFPIGEPDTVVRVSKKRNGKVEIQEGLEGVAVETVISRAELPDSLREKDQLRKRQERRNQDGSRRSYSSHRLFDAY